MISRGGLFCYMYHNQSKTGCKTLDIRERGKNYKVGRLEAWQLQSSDGYPIITYHPMLIKGLNSLLNKLERRSFNITLTVKEVFSTARQNALNGGGERSPHLWGGACKFVVKSDENISNEAIAELAREIGFGGVYSCPHFVYVDVWKKRKL